MKNYKNIFLLIFCLFLQIPLRAETLKCEIEKVWTVDSARKEAFKDLKPVLDLSWAPPIDPNLIENKQALNNRKKKVGNRVITQFGDGSYGIQILDEDNYDKEYYYSSSGELNAIDFRIFPTTIYSLQDFLASEQTDSIYPVKIYKHDYPSGKIIIIALKVKKGEDYIFKPAGELQYHWVGNNCYDLNGNIAITRNILK